MKYSSKDALVTIGDMFDFDRLRILYVKDIYI